MKLKRRGKQAVPVRRQVLRILLFFCLICSLLFLFFQNKKASAPRIYDCFLFYNELELLEVRLKEMSPYVDKFVLVESCETFRGAPKPFTFAENRERFAAYADQIIYIPLDKPLKTDDPWTRERYQRAQVLRGLKNCQKEDLIFLSDVDEIVRGSLIPQITTFLSSREVQAVICEQKMYFGYLNRFWSPWRGSVAMRYSDTKRMGIQKMRRVRNARPRLLRKANIQKVHLLPNAGWHFTSMGGPARFAAKIEAYSHTETDTPETKSAESFLRKVHSLTPQILDASFPACIYEQRHYYEAIGFLENH